MRRICCVVVLVLVVFLYGCTQTLLTPRDTPRSQVLVEFLIPDEKGNSRRLTNSVDLSYLKNHWSWDCGFEIGSYIYSAKVFYWEDADRYGYFIGQWSAEEKEWLSAFTSSFYRSEVLARNSTPVLANVKSASPSYYAAMLVGFYSEKPWPTYGKTLDCSLKPPS